MKRVTKIKQNVETLMKLQNEVTKLVEELQGVTVKYKDKFAVISLVHATGKYIDIDYKDENGKWIDTEVLTIDEFIHNVQFV